MTSFTISRRVALSGILGAAVAPAFPALALGTDEAEAFIKTILGELRELLKEDDAGPEGTAKFLKLLDAKAALPLVGKFAVGRSWREMSEAQRTSFQAAFRNYIAKTYQKRFGDYAGEDILIASSRDLGKKGVLVKSALTRPNGQEFDIEWLVSDRAGPTKLADIVFEGVSLSVTLRELFGGMIEQRGGDIDAFIADLASSEGA
ncbi:MAG: MlaC/ttg2D family ABC transporter substrate-binding protein [Pikeienuella sp.]